MKKIVFILLSLLSFEVAHSMDLPLDEQLSANSSYYAGLIPKNPSRQAFNPLWKEDFLSFRVTDSSGKMRNVQIFLKDFEEGNAEANAQAKAQFYAQSPGMAMQSYKNMLQLEKVQPLNGWLHLSYSYKQSRIACYGFATAAKTLDFKTKIPENYPLDVLDLDPNSFEEISSSTSSDSGYEEYVELFGQKLKNKDDAKLLIKYAGLIPVKQYRTAFNGFNFSEYVIMLIPDLISSQPKTRKVSFKIYGGPQKHEDYVNKIRPSKTSLVTNFSYLDLISIAEDNGSLVLEFGYLKVKSQNYNTFKVFTQIPLNYPNEDLSYMTEGLVQQKVNAPISAGTLAGLNARDLGKIFDPRFEGLVIRSQYLKPIELETVNSYVNNCGQKALKTSMNLNIHGFGGGHVSETYSLEEIKKCQSMGLICLHPYNSNPKLRAYVDGVDPRTIPQTSKDRGNVYNNSTVKYFFNQEAHEMLALKFDENSGKWGFGENEQFEAAMLEGNLVDLISSIKNFLLAGLPGVFHCKGGIHRTGQVEALFILLFAHRDNSLAMWSNFTEENLFDVGNYRIKGYFSDLLNCACGRSDKTYTEALWGSMYENRKVTPIEWNYVLSSQGMPRQENIDFIRDFGRFAQIFAELTKNKSVEDAYQDFLSMNMPWVTQEVFMLWHEVIGIFNKAIDDLAK